MDRNARFVYIYSVYVINIEYFWVNLVYELSWRCRNLYEYKYKLYVSSINHNKGGILHCIFYCYLLSDSKNFCPIVTIHIIYQIYLRSVEQDSYLSPRLSLQMLWPINLNFTYFQIKEIWFIFSPKSFFNLFADIHCCLFNFNILCSFFWSFIFLSFILLLFFLSLFSFRSWSLTTIRPMEE